MGVEELDLYIELLLSQYGEDYIDSLETLSDLILSEFDVAVSPKEIAFILQYQLDIEDVRTYTNNCGIYF